MITASTSGNATAFLKASRMYGVAVSPCTTVGTTVTAMDFARRESTFKISRIAAPVGEVTIAMCLGKVGIGLLREASKKTFCFQFGLQLLESFSQSPGADGLHHLAHQLVISARFVHRDTPSHNHFHAICRFEFQTRIVATKHHRCDLRLCIFEAEIKMSRGVIFEIGNLALDPHHADLALKKLFDVDVQLFDRINRRLIAFGRRVSLGIQGELRGNFCFAKSLI